MQPEAPPETTVSSLAKDAELLNPGNLLQNNVWMDSHAGRIVHVENPVHSRRIRFRSGERVETGPHDKIFEIAFLAVPIAVILVLQPNQFYRRYLLSLLPFALIGIGVVCGALSRRWWVALPMAIAVGVISLTSTFWVLGRPPQAWNCVAEYLRKRLEPTDTLLVGTHQAEMAASYYIVGKVPTWSIVYHGYKQGRYQPEAERRGTVWFVQPWQGLLPDFEHTIQQHYDKVKVCPGRFGHIMVFREKNESDKESDQGEVDTQSNLEHN